MTDKQQFCTACGCNLGPQMQFCPQCGKTIEGTEAYDRQVRFQNDAEQMIKEGRRSYLTIAILVYAIPALIAGILAIVEASHVAHTLMTNDDFMQYYTSHHWHFSESDLKSYVMYIGIIEMVSGACAAGTVYMIQKRRQHKLAFLLCLIAAVLCFWSVFGMILGFIMAWTVYDSEELFEDEAKA